MIPHKATSQLLLALVPLCYLVWLVIRLHVDLPFGDEWELVPLLDKLHVGTLSFQDVWQLRNEHRPLFPTLVTLGLAQMTQWNTGVELALNLVLAVATAAVCISPVWSSDEHAPAWRWWAVPILSVLFFSPAQWENWLWGQQLVVFMSVLSATRGFRLLAAPGSPARFTAALACGIFSMYCFGSGLTYWPVGLLAIALNSDLRKPRYVAAWIAVASVMIVTYFIDFHRPPGSVPVLVNLANPRVLGTLVVYLCKFLGAPVAGYSGTAAALTGLCGLALMVYLIASTFTLRGSGVALFASLIGLNAIVDGLQTAIGRAGYGTNSAIASRYQTLAAPFWVSIVLLSVVAIRELAARRPLPRWTRAIPIVTAIGLCVSVVVNGASSLDAATTRSNFLRNLRPDLQAATNWTAVAPLYLNAEQVVRERAQVLQKLGMSVYRETRAIDPANAQPMGVIDVPADGATVPMTTIAGGWAIDDRGIREIRLYLDGHFVNSLPLNTRRPDVAKAYPGYVRGTDVLGWTTMIGFSEPGPHAFNALAVDSDGARRDLGTVRVNVIR